MIVLATVLCSLLWVATPASGVTLTGILLYSADDFGHPSGIVTYDNPYILEAQAWRTHVAGHYHVLAVYEGLPPESLSGRRRELSAGDFSLFVPLYEGENFFTIVGDPGELTDGEVFLRYALNLYFEGGQQVPGISVLFPRYAEGTDGRIDPTRSDFLYSLGATLSVERSSGSAGADAQHTYYDDGIYRVTVASASFLPPPRQESPVDLLNVQRRGPNQPPREDYVGSLVIHVEPSAGLPGAPRPVAGIGGGGPKPAGSGIPGGGAGPVGGPVVPGFVGGPPAAGGGYMGNPAPGADYDAADGGWVSGDDFGSDEDYEDEYADDDGGTESRDALEALRGWLQNAVRDEPADDDPDGESTGADGATEDAAAEPTEDDDPEAVVTPSPEATPDLTPPAPTGTAAATPAATNASDEPLVATPTAVSGGTPQAESTPEPTPLAAQPDSTPAH